VSYGNKRKKDRSKSPPFVMIFKEMLASEAWGALTNASRVAYLHLKGKSINSDQTEIFLSYKEMERIMEKRTFSRSLKELQEIGFIEKTQMGGLFRRRNIFRLSEAWKEYRRPSGKNATISGGKNATVNEIIAKNR